LQQGQAASGGRDTVAEPYDHDGGPVQVRVAFGERPLEFRGLDALGDQGPVPIEGCIPPLVPLASMVVVPATTIGVGGTYTGASRGVP
jgi:hypothetical protein